MILFRLSRERDEAPRLGPRPPGPGSDVLRHPCTVPNRAEPFAGLVNITVEPSLIYADKPQTLDHLEDDIRRVIADIRPQMLEKVIENGTSRLDYIRASRGSSMPEIIFKISFFLKERKKPHPDLFDVRISEIGQTGHGWGAATPSALKGASSFAR
ncbi:hypothetical protein TNCV_769531 [Trichonephila clavipes]|nr:hypothetical protein TNCV_769531 [Trichonephila clavipes]